MGELCKQVPLTNTPPPIAAQGTDPVPHVPVSGYATTVSKLKFIAKLWFGWLPGPRSLKTQAQYKSNNHLTGGSARPHPPVRPSGYTTTVSKLKFIAKLCFMPGTFPVYQQGLQGAEFRTLGPMATISRPKNIRRARAKAGGKKQRSLRTAQRTVPPLGLVKQHSLPLLELLLLLAFRVCPRLFLFSSKHSPAAAKVSSTRHMRHNGAWPELYSTSKAGLSLTRRGDSAFSFRSYGGSCRASATLSHGGQEPATNQHPSTFTHSCF